MGSPYIAWGTGRSNSLIPLPLHPTCRYSSSSVPGLWLLNIRPCEEFLVCNLERRPGYRCNYGFNLLWGPKPDCLVVGHSQKAQIDNLQVIGLSVPAYSLLGPGSWHLLPALLEGWEKQKDPFLLAREKRILVEWNAFHCPEIQIYSCSDVDSKWIEWGRHPFRYLPRYHRT